MQANGRQMKVGLAMMGAGIAGLAASFELAGQAGKFEASMTNLQVISGANTEQMDKFRQAVLNADKSMFGPVESADALREMAQQGFTATEAMSMLKPVLDFATASLGELGIADASKLAGQAIKAFGMNASDTTKIVDQMSKSANISALSFRDLPIGIGVMARGAQALDQTFEESLITLGLVRNTIPTIERASHAATISMERLAGGRHAKMLQGLVQVFEKNTGAVRPFLDIINDLTPKLNAMSVKDRKAFLIKGFGAEGLAGVQAIMTQLTKGITKTNGEIVRGADAIKYLREQIAGSGGTAETIAAKQLETLPGQMKLLKADFERLGVVLGGPIAMALKPLVVGLGQFVTFIKNTFEKIPADIQKGIAQFVLFGSALLTVFGALLAGKALLALFGVTLGGIAASIGSLLLPLAGVATAIGGLVLLVQALRVNSEQTGKGVIGFFVDLGQKVALAWRGLMQLFTEGAFSGQVMEDLNKAENSGVKAFAIKVYLWVNRIKNFLTGLVDGFREKVREFEPTFTRLADLLGFVAESFGLIVGPAQENQNAFDAAGASGKSLGDTLATVAAVMSNVLFDGILVAYGALEVFKTGWAGIGPTAMWAATMIWSAVQLVAGVLGGDWNMAWKGAFDFVYGLIGKLLHGIAWVARAITLATDQVNNTLGVWAGRAPTTFTKDLDFGVKELDKMLAENKAEGMTMAGISPATFSPRSAAPAVPIATVANSPGLAAAGPNATGFGPDGYRLTAQAPQGPQTINLNNLIKVDGATLAEHQKRIMLDTLARGFSLGTQGGL